MRKAAVSGQFYPSSKKELESLVENLLKDAGKPENAFGIVVPHAGYEYSGKAAAFAYKAISKQKFDTFIILGSSHSARGVSLTDEDFETPLGVARNDKEFCNELVKEYGKNEDTHRYEHSIEVQLPFLLHIFKKVRIVPIAVSLEKYDECMKLVDLMLKTIKKLKRKVCVIASSDFTHYGPAYGYVPFSGVDAKKKLYELDRKAILLAEGLKGKEFFNYSQDTTICGFSAITTAIELCRKLGAQKAKLLKYYTSGDISGDYENAVGYAAIAFV